MAGRQATLVSSELGSICKVR